MVLGIEGDESEERDPRTKRIPVVELGWREGDRESLVFLRSRSPDVITPTDIGLLPVTETSVLLGPCQAHFYPNPSFAW